MLQDDFNDRKAEIESYLQLLEHIEATMREGSVVLNVRGEKEVSPEHDGKASGYSITPTQQKIMYSCLYLQLYNLVESTVIGCITRLETTIHEEKIEDWLKLLPCLRRELVRAWAKQNANGADDNRVNNIEMLINSIIQSGEMGFFSLDKKRNGGNWDDKEIETLIKGIGMNLSFDKPLYRSAKKHIETGIIPRYNNCGGLELIKKFRNELAHGEVSFVQCGERLDLIQLKELSQIVFDYLQAVINHFTSFITNKEYLLACTSGISHDN